MRLLWCFLMLIGCSVADMHKTYQQRNLSPSGLQNITTSLNDFDFDVNDEVITFENDKMEPVLDSHFYTKLSVTISDSMKLRDVFWQLAKLAGVNIFVTSDIEGGVSFESKNRPFLDILKDICSSCYLKYTINGNSVKIEHDSPMTQVYNLQFLNLQRETQSSVSIATDIFMNQALTNQNQRSPSNSSGDNLNGSNSVISGTIKNDFWTELEQNLKNIVGEEGSVSIHRQGGLITVVAPQLKQNEVQKYVDLLKETSESQVLIEAKILEVNLSKEFKNGINWNILRSGGATLVKDYADRTGLISFGVNRSNLSAVIGLIEKFGAVKTLSSPRITVLNNQSAILKVAQNEVIYIPELQRQYGSVSDSRGSDFLTTTLHTVPIGLIMSVQPSIDHKNNTVLLNLRPTISRIAGYKEVPFFYQQTSSNSVTNSPSIQSQKVPIIDVREMDSMLKLHSGQVVVMGGLMKETSRNNRNGLPGLNILDIVAGENDRGTDVTELVIFLKATILKRKYHHDADKRLYDKFADDPRPLRFKNEKRK
ncbi:MAG: hypothetical protein E7015_02985 [Alphaproteobacteria bacterium]|nr:hypothetical protein [Alphaproteobacteria bacterium]